MLSEVFWGRAATFGTAECHSECPAEPPDTTLMKLNCICGIAALTALAAASPISGQTLTDTFISIEPGVSAKGTFDGTNFRFVNSGIVQFTGFEAFCIEPLQGISVGEEVTYDIAYDYSTPEISGAIAKLTGGYYASGQSDLEAAAAQWAIWELLLDGPAGSLFTGKAQLMDLEVAVLANEFLAQLPNLPVTDVMFLTHPTRQDIVTTIPEPASLGLLAASCLLLPRRRRR